MLYLNHMFSVLVLCGLLFCMMQLLLCYLASSVSHIYTVFDYIYIYGHQLHICYSWTVSCIFKCIFQKSTIFLEIQIIKANILKKYYKYTKTSLQILTQSVALCMTRETINYYILIFNLPCKVEPIQNHQRCLYY